MKVDIIKSPDGKQIGLKVYDEPENEPGSPPDGLILRVREAEK